MKKCIGRNITGAIAVVALMALAGAGAYAATYTFTQGGFDGGGSVAGYFKAQDLDNNGWITSNEVWEFSVSAIGGIYAGATIYNAPRYPVGLAYDLSGHVLGDNANEFVDIFGPIQLGYTSGIHGGTLYDGFRHVPTSTTAELIYVNSPSPVPEPTSWAMLVAGVALLSVFAKRKKSC
jgi:hypothetical protein